MTAPSYDLSDLGATPVYDLSDLGGVPIEQQAQTNPSLLPRIGADLLGGYAKFGNGLLNAPDMLTQAVSPPGYLNGQHLPTYKPDYNYGQALGVNAPNLADKLLQDAAQYAPYMLGGELEAAPSLAARLGVQAGRGATFGATQSQNPGLGALIGGTIGAGSELAPAAIGATKNIISGAMGAIQPQKYAEQLLNNLGGGNTLEGNAQSLANDIKNAYTQRINQGAAQYAPVFDKYGNTPIYDALNGNGNYQAFNPSDLNYDRKLNKLNNNFTNNPTLQNAHNLQSQLGTSIRKLESMDNKGNLSVADRSTMQGYQDAQGALRGDINNFLTSQNPAAADQYNTATENWVQTVAPYLENPKIAPIAKGAITNPKNISITNLFGSPQPDIQQIVSDIGPQANNKILYSELGKTQSNLTPERLTTAFNSLDNKGLSSYITPSLAQQFEQLAGKTAARNAAQTAATGVLGAHFFGPMGAIAGAVGPSVLRRLGQFAPSINLPIKDSLLTALKAGYRPTVNTGTANLINYQGGQ